LDSLVPAPAGSVLNVVQRLFSLFPAGIAGIALAVLRSIVAVTVFAQAQAHPVTDCAIVVDGLASIVGSSLILGFLTPYCAAASCLAELSLLAWSTKTDGLQLLMAALTAGCVAALGPGAYSVDSKLFGRKLIAVPPGNAPR
jgi:uncharacterized membrane protein YphA (DoxX/SURF4 family)